MSSEIYELMKRSDEAHVVEKAHRRPRFVEDCVREMIRGVVDAFPDLNDAAFVSARQVNLETIHQHNVVAERYGTLGEVRRELSHGSRACAATPPARPGSTRSSPDPRTRAQSDARRHPRAPGRAAQGHHAPRPDARRRGSCASRSAPARCAAPICTCATTRSRPRSSPSCSAIRSSARPRTVAGSACPGSAGPTGPATTARPTARTSASTRASPAATSTAATRS